MKITFKTLIIMLFGLLTTACADETITPKFSSFESWDQYSTGNNWYYQFQNEFIGTTGVRKSKVIQNPVKTSKGNHSVLITVDNRSTEPAQITVWCKADRREESIATISLLPGTVTYEVELNLPMNGYIGLEATGDSFNLDVISIEFQIPS